MYCEINVVMNIKLCSKYFKSVFLYVLKNSVYRLRMRQIVDDRNIEWVQRAYIVECHRSRVEMAAAHGQ